MSDAEFDDWMAALPPCPGIRHIDDDDEADEAAAIADHHAGRSYSHALVSQWLMTWGTKDRKPFQDWLAARDD